MRGDLMEKKPLYLSRVAPSVLLIALVVTANAFGAGPIDLAQATGTFTGGGVTLSADELRRFADEHAAHRAAVAAASTPEQAEGVAGGAPRGGPLPPGDVFIVECSGAFGFSTIQSAIEAAADGDVVVVLPNDCNASGGWVETIDFLGKAIRVQSANPVDEAVVNATKITPSGVEPFAVFDSGEDRASVMMGLNFHEDGEPAAQSVRIVGTGPTILNCLTTNAPGTRPSPQGFTIEDGFPLIEIGRAHV